MTPYTWNADREIITPTQFRSVIGGGWRNFIRRGYTWQSINPEIQSDLTCTAFPGNVQFAASSQDWSDICIDGTFSMKRHVLEGNGHNAEPEFQMSLAVEAQHNVTGHISETNPTQMIYPNAWDSADLKLGIWQGRSARIEKVVDIHTMPPGDSEFIEYSFLVRSSTAQVLAGPNHDISPWDNGHAELNGSDAFVALKGSELRGTVLRTPVAWYYENGEMVRVPVRVTFDILADGETVRATKFIPRSLISTALAAGSHLYTDATFNPDGNPESTTMDGYTFRQGPSDGSHVWEDLIVGAGTASSDGWDIKGGPHAAAWTGVNVFYQLERAWYGFDTSSIGAGQQIDSASLTLSKYNTDTNNTDWDAEAMNVYEAVPATATAIATTDHNNMGTAKFSDTGVTYGTLRQAAQKSKHEWTFNATGLTGVDPEGLTQLGVAWEADRAQTSVPSPASNVTYEVNFYAAEFTGTVEDPLLTVSHTAAPTFIPAWALSANQ